MAKKALGPEHEWTEYVTAVWFDPGGTTGWSVMSVDPLALVDPNVKILDSIFHWAQGEIVGPERDQADEAAELICAWPGCVVGIESFRLRQFRRDEDLLSPVRLGSMIDWAAGRGGGAGVAADVLPAPVVWQTPETAMSTATDDRLREWGLYVREGGLGHARDATRHAITWYRKCKEGVQRGAAKRRAESWPWRFRADGSLMAVEGAAVLGAVSLVGTAPADPTAK